MIPGLAGGFLWALDTVLLAQVLAPFSMEPMAPLAATALHDLMSALWLAILTTVRHRWHRVFEALKNPDGRRILLAALLGGPVGMTGYVMAVSSIGPGLAAGISSCYPALGMGLAVLFLKERVSRRQITGILVSLVCLLGLSAGGIESGVAVSGVLWALAGTFGWAAEGLLVQKAQKTDSETALFLRQCLSALVFWLVILPVTGSVSLAASMMKAPALPAAASLAGTASYLCYYLAIRKLTAARAMPLNVTYCAWAVFLTWLFGGAAPSVTEILCCIGIVGGACLAANPPIRTKGSDAGAE